MAKLGCASVLAADVQGLTPLGADLELHGPEGAIQDVPAVEGGVLCNPVHLGLEGFHLLVDGGAVSVGVGVVKALHRQLTNALKVRADDVQGAFRRLGEGNAVVGVALGDRATANARGETLTDGEASGVVLSTVDAKARG